MNSVMPAAQYSQSQISSSTPMRRASACSLPAASVASSRSISCAGGARGRRGRRRRGASRSRGSRRAATPRACPTSRSGRSPRTRRGRSPPASLQLHHAGPRLRRAVGRLVVDRGLDREVEQLVGRVRRARERGGGHGEQGAGRTRAGGAAHLLPDRRATRSLEPCLAPTPAGATAAIAWRRSSTRSAAASIPQLSRTRSAGTAAREPSTDWCVIACGTSISDSTPPSDSASANSFVARDDLDRVGMAEADHAGEAGPADVADARLLAQERAHRARVLRVGGHAQVQRAQAAVHEEAVERAGHGADRELRRSGPPRAAPGRATTTAPPTVSECPPRYFVVECTTAPAPSSSGRWLTGVANVLSTATSTSPATASMTRRRGRPP